ncbi:MAG: hypothetical protein IJZ21_04525, partial [Clostridia bacterium]|nr:hypothetical protein [Clostridia bacterium]
EVNSETSEKTMSVDAIVEMLNLGKEMAKCEADEKMSIGYVLEQIEKIQNQTDHIGMSIAALGNMVPSQNGPDISEKAESIATVVKCRETTNQKLIAFYEKMYEDLKPINSAKDKALDIVSTAIQNSAFEGEGFLEKISDLLDTIRHIG